MRPGRRRSELRRSAAQPLASSGAEAMTTTAETNEAERRRWNDERWAAVWPKRERLTDRVTPFLLGAAKLGAGERVLDVGCGGGRTSLAAALAVGERGRVVGADLSEAASCRLAVRRAGEQRFENVRFTVVDMQTGSVDGRPFDVALSQFGVMFFDEPVVAFANIRAHLRPGGRLVFVCWQASERNAWCFSAALPDLLPAPPAPAPGKSPAGPFALADPERTTAVLREAGFVEVGCSPHELEVDAPPESVVDEVQFELMGVPPDEIARTRELVDRHMQQFVVAPGLSRFPLAFQVFAASNP